MPARNDRPPSLRVVADPESPNSEASQLVALIRQVTRGQNEAFEQLYDLTSARVYGIVLRVLRSPDQSAEVTQEVYLEAWRQAADYRSEVGSVIAWLLTIAHRRAVDRVRSVTRRDDREERYEREARSDDTDVVWSDVARRADSSRVREAMTSLSPMQRQALDLAYFGGHTHSEVARILELPLGTAKTRIRDGLIGLRQRLGEGS